MSSRKRKKRGKERAAESAESQGTELEAVDEAAADSDGESEESQAADDAEAVEADADGGGVEPLEELEAPAVSEISELKPGRKRKRKAADEEPALEPAETSDAEPSAESDADADAPASEDEEEDAEAYGDDAAKEAPKTRGQLKRVLESLIFVSDQVITAVQLGRITKTKVGEVREALAEISVDYDGRGIELVEVNGGYQFRSLASSGPYVRSLVAQRPVRLTRAQLETLALIAYRQPITRPEVDDVRGVDSGSAIKVLLERELIKILGRKDDAGRPLLYGTTPFFLEFFGMNTMQELPTLREFTELSDEHQELFKRKTNEIGDLSAEAEVPVSFSGADGYVPSKAEAEGAQPWEEEPAGEGQPAQDASPEEAAVEAGDGGEAQDASEPFEASDDSDDVADLSAVADTEEEEELLDAEELAQEPDDDAELEPDGEQDADPAPQSSTWDDEPEDDA